VSASTDTNCGGSIKIWWTASTGDHSNGYYLYRGTSSSFSPSLSNLVQGGIGSNPTSGSPYIDWNEGGTDMNIGTTYYYKVTASGSGGNTTSSAASSKGSAAGGGGTTAPTPPPACRTTGQTCGLPGTCCGGLTCSSGTCHTSSGTSTPTTAACKNDGVTCSLGNQCCSGTCGDDGSGTKRCGADGSGGGGGGDATPYDLKVEVFNDDNQNGIRDTDRSGGTPDETYYTSSVSVHVYQAGTEFNAAFSGGQTTISSSINANMIVTLNPVTGKKLSSGSTNPQTKVPENQLTCGRSCTFPKASFGLITGTWPSTPTPTKAATPTPTKTGTPTPTPPPCPYAACGKVTYCGSGALVSGIYVNVVGSSGGSSYNYATNASGNYASVVNRPGNSGADITIDMDYPLNSSFSGYEVTSPVSGSYTNVPYQSVRNFVICAVPTPTPLSTISGKIYDKLTGNTLKGGTVRIYQYPSSTYPVAKFTQTFGSNELANYSFDGLSPAIHYDVKVTGKDPAWSTWKFVTPSTGSYSNLAVGATANFALQDPAVRVSHSVAGYVYYERNPTKCTVGGTYAGLSGIPISVYDPSNTPFGSPTTTVSSPLGYYQILNKLTAQGTMSLVMGSTDTYFVEGVRHGPLTTYNEPYTPGIGYQWDFDGSTGTTDAIYLCITDKPSDPWFVTDNGDVRQGAIKNPVPSTKSPTTAGNTASAFYSSTGNTDLGSVSSTIKWLVNKESAVNAPPPNSGGSTSYSFYINRVKQFKIATKDLPGISCDSATPTKNCISALNGAEAGGNIYFVDGNLTIKSNSDIVNLAGQNKRAVVLVNGNVRINSTISVGVSNLLIIAAKGDITIDSSIGNSSPNPNPTGVTPSNLDGIFTAEGNIILDNNDGVNKQLIVSGTLIANANRPFATNGSGKIIINRDLGIDNNTSPVLFVAPRLKFITLLTDFYRVSSKFWTEVAP
jgi:hypothetical protein